MIYLSVVDSTNPNGTGRTAVFGQNLDSLWIIGEQLAHILLIAALAHEVGIHFVAIHEMELLDLGLRDRGGDIERGAGIAAAVMSMLRERAGESHGRLRLFKTASKNKFGSGFILSANQLTAAFGHRVARSIVYVLSIGILAGENAAAFSLLVAGVSVLMPFCHGVTGIVVRVAFYQSVARIRVCVLVHGAGQSAFLSKGADRQQSQTQNQCQDNR